MKRHTVLFLVFFSLSVNCFGINASENEYFDKGLSLYQKNDFDLAGKAEYTIHNNNFTALNDSMVMCRFVSERCIGLFISRKYADLINFVTGWDTDKDELERTGGSVISS